MIFDHLLLAGMIKILLIFILITAAFIITIRDLLSLVSVYALQSLLLVVLALVMYLMEGRPAVLLSLAALTLLSKVFVIPRYIRRIQKSMKIKRDLEFHYMSPTSLIFASILILVFIYNSFSKLFRELFSDNLLFMGSVIGVSLAFMGMAVIFSRKKTITNIVGYLTMENGVLLFGMFLAELPMIIEVLIIVDLIVLTLLSSILAFGIDSPIEEFHARLNPFRKKVSEEDAE